MKSLYRLLLIAAVAGPVYAIGCIQTPTTEHGYNFIPNTGSVICGLLPANIAALLPFGACG